MCRIGRGKIRWIGTDESGISLALGQANVRKRQPRIGEHASTEACPGVGGGGRYTSREQLLSSPICADSQRGTEGSCFPSHTCTSTHAHAHIHAHIHANTHTHTSTLHRQLEEQVVPFHICTTEDKLHTHMYIHPHDTVSWRSGRCHFIFARRRRSRGGGWGPH